MGDSDLERALPAAPFWATRDRDAGELSDEIEIWLVRPEMLRFADRDVTWIAPLGEVDRRETRWGALSLERAYALLRTLPDDELMLVKYD